MRTVSLMALASFFILWGVYSFLKDETILQRDHTDNPSPILTHQDPESETSNKEADIFSQKKRRDLDKIGQVINEDNVEIEQEKRNQIKIEKAIYENNYNLKEKQVLLEQSFIDQTSSLKDTKRIQEEIVTLKNKMKLGVSNTEKWDPKFVFYLMMQENYTYQEINGIKSLTENGINSEEINYINEQIKDAAFKDKIQAFKNQGETGRIIASLKNTPKEKDEFLEEHSLKKTSAESKIIEMNYNQEENEEPLYGNNQ